MSVQTFTVYDIFEMNARRYATGIAVTEQDRTLTFEALLEQVNTVAQGLLNHGIAPKDRIAILAMNHLEYLVLKGAAAAMGAILVPINWRLSQDEIAYILEDSGAKLLFFDDACKAQLDALVNAEQFTGTPVSISGIHKNGPGWEDFNQPPVSASPLTPPERDDIFCLIYTAAVEGHPRGAALSHENMVISNLQTCLTMGLTREDAYLNMVPLFHITGMNLALATLHMGGKNIIMEKFNAPEAIALAAKENVSLVASFPPILSTLLDNMKQGDLTSINHVTGIDSPDNITTFTQKTGAQFWILYGQSETSGFVTLSDHSLMPGAAGKQCPVSNIAVLDDDDTALPRDTPGEIAVRGPVVFQGFWKKDGNLDRSTIRNGWHHTGDMGRIDKNGFLWFEGRKPEKELIKPGGENVYPAEVEKVILTHPDVLSVCVIGVPDPKFGEGVKAVCVKKPEANLDGPALIAFVGERIARYKKPGYVEFVDAMPEKENGTIDRMQVKEKYGRA
ncbi:Acyl-CoA synthetase (AMP-forming)/AMP-acid ligase II [Desulfocicer vacuolatum DSM 3385]|uniref:Acyl-CoA synthetase (AMP-forming)/AMP-acid ligase II n=1 Tax=Desulfocicer vacuolatum DSM 3385 TaxID=1121400 RepID=A0A1W2BS94_9BACT|nr:AMP-binding protein [Desulfocicer vacuolatum]SMC75604.1 Acyl-CoA synthetase (AMP-forming)/AMP-acid ligase II [Desulfocicer vacuolatum DSM 3385]